MAVWEGEHLPEKESHASRDRVKQRRGARAKQFAGSLSQL